MTAKTEEQELDLTRAYEIAEEEYGKQGPIIRVLQKVQAEYGYIPPEYLPEMAEILEVPLAKIFGALTFYSQFYTSPRGKYIVKVCVGTACHVQGAKDILDRMKDELKVGAGETTEDMMFTLEPVACIGSCGLAPLCLINTETAANMTPAGMAGKIQAIVEKESAGVAEE
ncbi:MAG: NAD(P)H-dependent oxidoreductase subunit E [Nitrospirota bacterium]|nr:NAD(P)H-dependent oxidoreductase subunit E [Nitrospirota bacterium]